MHCEGHAPRLAPRGFSIAIATIDRAPIWRDYCRTVCGTSEGISLEAARRASATARPARDGRVDRASDLTFWAVRMLPNLVRSANPIRRIPAVRSSAIGVATSASPAAQAASSAGVSERPMSVSLLSGHPREQSAISADSRPQA